MEGERRILHNRAGLGHPYNPLTTVGLASFSLTDTESLSHNPVPPWGGNIFHSHRQDIIILPRVHQSRDSETTSSGSSLASSASAPSEFG